MTRTATDLPALRRRLHAAPEISNHEGATAEAIADELARFEPDALHRGVGGHGVLAVWRGPEPGPTVVLRAELDALPVTERDGRPHGSRHTGTHHACGHDGHMTALVGVGAGLGARRPPRGAVALLFQPAEETGEGAARVAADRRWVEAGGDWVFAVHNLPGVPLGEVRLRSGPVAAASVGLEVRLRGVSSHAAHPELGRSPAGAMADLVRALDSLAGRHSAGVDDRFAVSTVIHARLGEIAFGTTPGDAVVMATLRSDDQALFDRLREEAVALAHECGGRHRVAVEVDWREPFPVTHNHPDAIEVARRAALAAGLAATDMEAPMRWSEDIGHLVNPVRGALLVVGAGADVAPLHSPDYDFPDPLLGPLVDLHTRILAGLGVVDLPERSS